MRIILDTNFLLIPAIFKVDIFAEIRRILDFNYSLNIMDKTIEELDNIIETQTGKNKAAAKLAIQLIKKTHVNIIKSKQDAEVDTLIIRIASKETIVATQDKQLKKRLKDKVKGIIALRQQKYLVLTT